MTTIAFKDGILAADTLATCGNSREGTVMKVVRRGSLAAAASGAATKGRRFLDWFAGGMVGDVPEMDDPIEDRRGWGYILGYRDIVITFGPDGIEFTHQELFATGSGWELAMGAMSAGASAEEAVRIAMRHDTKSGGDVTVLRLKEEALTTVRWAVGERDFRAMIHEFPAARVWRPAHPEDWQLTPAP